MLTRKISISIIIICCISSILFGQKVKTDTIEVSKNLAATLQFSSNIKTPIFGNNPKNKNYNVYVNENVLITSAAREDAPLTTLTILLEGNNLFRGYIKYSESTKKNYYNYQKSKSNGKKRNVERETDTRKIVREREGLSTVKRGNNRQNELAEQKTNSHISETLIDKRLGKIIEKKRKIKTIGKIVGKVIFQVDNIYNDSKYSYISVAINNKSTSRYVIDGLMLRYIEKGGFLNMKEKNKERVFPEKVLYSDGKHIGAKSEEKLAFVIPQFGTDKGDLMIKFKEKSGDRNINIAVPVKKINSSELFK